VRKHRLPVIGDGAAGRNAIEPASVSVWLPRVLFRLVIYAVMPDVFAPSWCVEVEPTGHDCRWPFNLFVHRVASATEETKNVARDHRERSDGRRRPPWQ
jgi:hypothetical protein